MPALVSLLLMLMKGLKMVMYYESCCCCHFISLSPRSARVSIVGVDVEVEIDDVVGAVDGDDNDND